MPCHKLASIMVGKMFEIMNKGHIDAIHYNTVLVAIWRNFIIVAILLFVVNNRIFEGKQNNN